jgi:hypothetical protein
MSEPASTEYHDRHLSAESVRTRELADALEATYDIVFLGSSWDARCLTLASTRITASRVVLFLPSNRGTSGRRGQHDSQLLQWAKTVGDLVVVEDDSEELGRVHEALVSELNEVRKLADRSIRVLIDLSAMTRYFTLGLVACCLNDSVASYVDVVYAEGLYQQSSTGVMPSPLAASALWDAVGIPMLEGDWFPTHGRHFLVSAGFEGNAVARLADRWDPDSITVMLPIPGLLPEYETRVRAANETWMRHVDVAPEDVWESPAADALATWKLLSESRTLDAPGRNIYCLLNGSKPHALAITLYAMARGTPAVLYVRPTRHDERNITSTGDIWRYRLRDRSLIG